MCCEFGPSSTPYPTPLREECALLVDIQSERLPVWGPPCSQEPTWKAGYEVLLQQQNLDTPEGDAHVVTLLFVDHDTEIARAGPGRRYGRRRQRRRLVFYRRQCASVRAWRFR